MKPCIRADLERYYACWLSAERLYDQWAQAHGVSTHELFVLCSLTHQAGSTTQATISKEWHIPKQTVNTVLKKLERQGMAWLEPDPRDRRGKLARLTEKGRHYAQPLCHALERLEEQAMAHMTAEQRAGLLDGYETFLNAFAAALHKEGENE